MLQASIVFTLRWVGLRDGREFEQSFQMWGKFYFLIWILVQCWKLTMLHTLDLSSLLCVLLITISYIKVVWRVLGWGVEAELGNTMLAWPAHSPENSKNEQMLG